MVKAVLILLCGIITSLFLFPFNLPIQMVVNTKMVLAAIGLILFILDKVVIRQFSVSMDFLVLSIICALISVWAFVSTTINETSDYVFVKYIISVWVWLGAAYTVIWTIRATHGYLNLTIIGNYLIVVCVAQCILAYWMFLSPPLKSFINSLMGESDLFMGVVEGRLYGLGAALDPAGLRFSAILVIIAHQICQTDYSRNGWMGFGYLSAFAIITVIGNMIARTTTVGSLLAVVYIIIHPLLGPRMPNAKAFFTLLIPILLCTIGLIVWFYHTNLQFRINLRFGFEGFFSLVEKGRWESHSTNILKNMIVWPESLKTWIIGDGYFDTSLPDRFGRIQRGFYMQTDIGYLRYIFYFGIVGLLGMIYVPVQITITCGKVFKKHVWLFVMFLLITLIGWFKVSSDIIMVFAPFLILAYQADYALTPCTSSTT